MSIISPAVASLLGTLHGHPDSEIFAALQGAYEDPPCDLNQWDHLILLNEMFRCAIAIQQPTLIERYLPDAQHLITSNDLPETTILGYFICLVGNYFDAIKQYQRAEELYLRVIQTYTRSPKESMIAPNTLTPRWIAVISMAKSCMQQGMTRSATTYYSVAISEIAQYYARPTEDLVYLRSDIGQAHLALGETDKAIRALTKSLNDATLVYGDPHPITAGIAERVAHAYIKSQLYVHAQLFMKRAHASYVHLQDHLSIVRCLCNLGALAYLAGKHDESYLATQQTLSAINHTVVPDSTRMSVLWNCAITARSTKRTDEAVAYCRAVRQLIISTIQDSAERRDAYLEQLLGLESYCTNGTQEGHPPFLMNE